MDRVSCYKTPYSNQCNAGALTGQVLIKKNSSKQTIPKT